MATATDAYEGTAVSPAGPAQDFFEVTPSDGDDLPERTVGLYVGVAGDVAVQRRKTAAVVRFRNVPAGTTLPIRCRRIMQTGTTADAIVGLL